MAKTESSKQLILGGHSWFSSLANDPPLTPAQHVELFEAALDCGITVFDTTYQGERLALGAAMEASGRRDEATVICWNFLDVSGPEESWSGAQDGPRLITSATLEQWRTELRTERLDWVCIHELGDDRQAENQQQQELCAAWLKQGEISRLGIWNPGANAAAKYGTGAPFSFMVRPFNIANSDSAAFAACAALGWECFACSPFVRGWDLDKLVEAAGAGISAAQVADRMLRFSLHQGFVSGLVTASRRVEWLATNLQSASRGPVSEEELQQLLGLAATAGLLAGRPAL